MPVHTIKLSVTNKEEIDALRNLLNELDWLQRELVHTSFENITVDSETFKVLGPIKKKHPEDIEDFFTEALAELGNIHTSRILMNLEVLLENCADPTRDTLDFHPDIKQGLELLEKSNAE